MSYAASNYMRLGLIGLAQEHRNRLAGIVKPIPPAYVGEALETLDPVLVTWRDANPRADTPRWYREIEEFCNANHARAWTVCALFVQQAEGLTNTRNLLSCARSAKRMALCNHTTGYYTGSSRVVAGEYDDNLLFTCPECGYKGA